MGDESPLDSPLSLGNASQVRARTDVPADTRKVLSKPPFVFLVKPLCHIFTCQGCSSVKSPSFLFPRKWAPEQCQPWRDKQVPGVWRAWHLRKHLGNHLVTGPLPRPRSRKRPLSSVSQSSMGQAAGDAKMLCPGQLRLFSWEHSPSLAFEVAGGSEGSCCLHPALKNDVPGLPRGRCG